MIPARYGVASQSHIVAFVIALMLIEDRQEASK